MAVDPQISLGIQTPQLAQGGGVAGQFNSWMEVLTRLNQNALFQQTFAARQRAGQIIAGAPDIETGLAQLPRDPVVAGFAGPILNEYRQMQQTLTQIGGEQQTQAINGLGAVMKAFPAGMDNPAMLEPAISAQLRTLSPLARSRVQEAVNDLKTGLLDGVPSAGAMQSDPRLAALGRSMYQKNLGALLISTGVSPQTVRQFTGAVDPSFQTITGPQQQAIPGIVGSPTMFGPNVFAPLGGAGMVPAGSASGPAALGAPSSGPGILQGPTAEQRTSMEKSGAFAGDLAEQMATNLKNLPNDVYRINTMVDALGKFRAGGGADFRASMAKGLQALKNAGITNISDDMINKVGNEDLASGQIFDAEIRPYVTRQLAQDAAGTGRVMLPEVQAYLSMLNKTADPETIRTLLNQAKYQLRVRYDQAQRYSDFKQMIARGDPQTAGLGPADFYSWWTRNTTDDKLPMKAGGFDLSPIPKERIKGTQPDSGRPPIESFFR